MRYGCLSTLSNVPSPKKNAELLAVSIDQLQSLDKTYRHRISCLGLRMTGNCSEAEDLTQEAFLRLFHNFEIFCRESSFYTRLRRLAIRVVLPRIQKPSWRSQTSPDALVSADTSGKSSSGIEFGCVDGGLRAALARTDLQRVLDRLPPGFRTALSLHGVEDYGHGQISRLMSRTIGTAKSQLHQARSRICGFYGAYERSELVA